MNEHTIVPTQIYARSVLATIPVVGNDTPRCFRPIHSTRATDRELKLNIHNKLRIDIV
jgi:hypothetical protein